MKILIVGSALRYQSLEQIYIKHLKKYINDIDIYEINEVWFKNKSILGKVINRIFSGYFKTKINSGLLEKVKTYNPDIIWIFKGVEITVETLQKIKKNTSAKLVNYNPDHPFIRVFQSSGGKNIEDCVPLYDLHFCYSASLCEEIRTRFNIPTVQLPFGFEIDKHTFSIASEQNEIKKVAFVGSADKYRTEIIKFLAQNNIQVDVYGYNNWENFLKADQFIQIFDCVEEDEFWKTLSKYRVQLNVFRPHNVGSHNMRTFEIPAIGGIQLAPNSKEHSTFFEPQKNIFLYDSLDQLLMQVKYLLSLSDESAALIRQSARDKSLIADYSYQQRAKTVFETFSQLLNQPVQL
jgi:spore maturation protein CgeB